MNVANHLRDPRKQGVKDTPPQVSMWLIHKILAAFGSRLKINSKIQIMSLWTTSCVPNPQP